MGGVEGGDRPHVPPTAAQPSRDFFRSAALSTLRTIKWARSLPLWCISWMCWLLPTVKTAPSIFVAVMLAFIFYKLTVVSSELHRRRKSNSLITRLKFGTILIMVLKDIKKNYVLLDVIRMPVLLLYICAFLFDVAGMKKYGRRGLIYFVNQLKTRDGFQEIYRIMWYPGYISPYDDAKNWLRDSHPDVHP